MLSSSFEMQFVMAEAALSRNFKRAQNVHVTNALPDFF